MVGAIAVPVYHATSGAVLCSLVQRIGFGTSGGPHMYFFAQTTGSGDVYFDYKVLLKRL
jgi:hypothetical protein